MKPAIHRRSMPVFVVALALAGGARLAAAQAPARLPIAIIDVQRILAESDEGKKETAKIKALQEDRARQLEQMEAEVQKLRQKLTDLGFSISEEERTKLQRSIEDKVIEGERFRKDADREIKSRLEDVFASFEKRIFPIIEKLGPDKGVQLILNRDMPGLVWADKSVDITPDVIQRFNSMPGGGAAAPARAPGK